MSDCIEWTGYRDPKTGYGRLNRRHSGKQHCLYAHRVEWEKHFGAIPAGLEILHTCDNPPCINIDHLMLGTHKANMLDSVRKGRQGTTKAYGEQSGRSKLLEQQVVDIKRRLTAGETLVSIGALYGVNYMTIKSIKTGRTWAWLQPSR